MIHWAWLIPVAIVSGTAGFMLCALLVMAKQSDEAIDQIHRPRTKQDMEDWVRSGKTGVLNRETKYDDNGRMEL